LFCKKYKKPFDWFKGGSCDYWWHVSTSLLERIGSLGEMRGRKEEKHCKVSWIYGM
jgi:hypothetical protein